MELTENQVHLLQEFSERYCLAHVGGKVMIFDQEDGSYMRPTEWKHFDKRHRIGQIPIRTFFLNEWPEMREYPDGVKFMPGEIDGKPGVLNLWEGWGITPLPGSWDRLKAHIFTILCRKDQVVFDYLLDWIAFGFQNPTAKMGSAVGIQGKQGSGKSLLGDTLRLIYRNEHSAVLSDPNLIAGSFTGHFLNVQLVQIEEAFFAGDHAAARRLKDIITGDTFTIHPKGLTPFAVPNILRIIVTTNDLHMLQIDRDDRRWLILDTDDTWADDPSHFKPLWNEIHNDGAMAFFWDMLHRPVPDRFNSMTPPKTGAKIGQAVQSLHGLDAWLMACLEAGQFVGNPGEAEVAMINHHWQSDWQNVWFKHIDVCFSRWAKDHGEYPKLTPHAVTKILRDRYGVEKINKQYYQFPPVAEFRKQFAIALGVDWDEIC